MEPLVSVIIPCFNDGKYINEAIASVASQDYANKEIIVVNDHSDDRLTINILNDLQHSGIVVINTPENKKGLPAARNAGIAVARGKYIVALDSDDKLAPTYITKTVSFLESHPETAICYSRAAFFGVKSGEWKLPSYSWQALLCGNMIYATAVYRREDWANIGGYDESLVLGLEDYAFWLHMLAERQEAVHRIDEILFFYRIRKRSLVAQMNRNFLKTYTALFKQCSDIYRDNCELLFISLMESKFEMSQEHCLISYKFARHVFKVEHFLRSLLKRILGR